MKWSSILNVLPRECMLSEGLGCVLPIFPKYSALIYQQEKLYEYRRTTPRHSIKYCLIYETSPVRKITGYFNIGQIIVDTPDNIWNLTGCDGCIPHSDFNNYFANKSQGTALQILDPHLFFDAIDIFTIGLKAPQSLVYL